MKKGLLITLLGLSLALTGCQDASSSTPSDSSSEYPISETSPPSSETSLPSSETSIPPSEIPTTEDITIVVSVKGLTVNEGNALFFGSMLGGTPSAWASTKMTKNNDDTWETTFLNIEEGYYDYNVYIGLESNSTSWENINDEGSSATPRTIGVLVGTTTYNIDATFKSQPDVSNVANLALNITTDIALTASNHLWVWTSITGGEVKLNGSGTSWSYEFVDALVGEVTFTAVIGTATSIPNWNYKSTNITDYKISFTKENPVINLNATFAEQPEEPSESDYSVFVNFEVSNLPGSEYPKIVVGDDWISTTIVENSTYTYTVPKLSGEEVLSFYFYAWADPAGDHKVFLDANQTPFSVTVTGETTIHVTGDFSTGLGAIVS